MVIGKRSVDEVNFDLRSLCSFLLIKLVNWVVDKLNVILKNCFAQPEVADLSSRSRNFMVFDTPSLALQEEENASGAEQLAIAILNDHFEHHYDNLVLRFEEIALLAEKVKRNKWPRHLFAYANVPVKELYFAVSSFNCCQFLK